MEHSFSSFLIGAFLGVGCLVALFLFGLFLLIRASRDYDATDKPHDSDV